MNGFAIRLLYAPGEGWGDDPKRRAVIRIVPFHWIPAPPCQAPGAGSGLIRTSGATCDTALHRTPGPCSGDWTRVVSVPHANSGHPRRAAVGAVNMLGPSPRHVVRVAWAAQHASLLANCINVEARGDFSCVREMLVVEVVSFW